MVIIATEPPEVILPVVSSVISIFVVESAIAPDASEILLSSIRVPSAFKVSATR